MGEIVGHYNYSLVNDAVLGRGTNGTVYRGRCIDNGDFVALKQLHDVDEVEAEELEIIKKLDSDCIVKVLDVAHSQSSAYIVMELCDASLDDHLIALKGRAKTMHPDNLERVVQCIADGYSNLHRKGIVHRDIKPQNIMLKYQGNETIGMHREPKILTAKLADFGSSRIGEDNFTNICGTPLYMAPEIGANMLHSSQYNSQVDMWAIGCAIYECINLEEAFNESSLCRLFLQASCSSDDLTNSGYRAPTLRLDSRRCTFYDELIARLLDIDPDSRMTPEQFCDAVKARQVPKCHLTKQMSTAKSDGDLSKHDRRWARQMSVEDPESRRSWSEYAWRALKLLEDYMIKSTFNNVSMTSHSDTDTVST